MHLPATPVRLGLRENLAQFSLLVLVNAFIGGMVGLERTVVPLIGTEEFRIGSETVVFSFIIAFGLVKAFVNLASGLLADRFTRKTVLIAGWLVGLPVPFMLAYGPFVGMDRRRERVAGNQSGACLVDDRQHEDRSGRASPSRSGDGPQ